MLIYVVSLEFEYLNTNRYSNKIILIQDYWIQRAYVGDLLGLVDIFSRDSDLTTSVVRLCVGGWVCLIP